MRQAFLVKLFVVSLICKSIYGQPAPAPAPAPAPLPVNPNLAGSDCSTTAPGGSMYADNFNTVLSALVTMAGQGDLSGSTTSGAGEDLADGYYYCRGKGLVSPAECESCVRDASVELAACTTGDSAIAWFGACTVHVANSVITGVLQTEPLKVVQPSPNEVTPDPSAQQDVIRDLILNTLSEAKADPILHFGSNFINFGPGVRYDVMAQCAPAISSADCQTCLDQAVGAVESSCTGCRPGPLIFVMMPSCQYMLGFE